MPTINHTITVTINGTDRSSLLLKDSLYIRTSIGNKGDTASFRLRDDTGAFVPLDWYEVTIAVNGTNVFGGYITSRRAAGMGSGSTKTAVWNVECRDWSAVLDTAIVDIAYTDSADSTIIASLFSTYLSGEGFDAATNVSPVDTDVDIAFENITVRDALNQLASTIGAQWHVAPDKSLYWYSPTSPASAAFNIDVVSPNDSTTFDVLANSLQYGIDANTIVNSVRIIGGEEQSGKITDTFAADGVKDTFGPFTAKPGSVWRVTFYVGAILHTHFADSVGYEPGDSLEVDGGAYNVLANLESRYVKITKADGSVPDNATNVTVIYYALVPVDVTVDDGASQGEYSRVFEQTIYDEALTSTALAQTYGERVIAEYAFGRETVRFDVTEHGLLPGRLITINAPVLNIPSTYDGALALENRIDLLLLEDGTSRLLLENYGESRQYLIQEVTIRTVVTGSNVFMVVATVSSGKYVPTILDSLAGIQQFSGGSGRLPAQRTVGRLDRIANNLGEIVAGRATFTDGGTAPFTWDNYADHTGLVVGLEEDGSNAYGAMYIMNDGTVTTKVGFMDGLASVGGVTPTGWGIWTENGYYSGAIAATSGNIGGWTIAANQIYANGGTIATKVLPINSSNPGVYLNSAGLFGYGTLGLTFSIPTNPALAPYFSSGTINNVVYEVYESGIMRTSADPSADGGVQIDNSGIFAYATPAEGGALRFSVDANTGILTAINGVFSGAVSASSFTGGTITGGTITGGYITGGTVNAAQMTGGTITAGRFSGGTISAAVFTGGTTTAGTISASTISGGTVTGGFISGGTISAAVFTGGTTTAGTISASTISGGTVSSSLFSGGTVSLGAGTLTITSSGINLNQSGTAGVYSDTTPLFTRLITNGTVLGYFGQYVNNVTATGYEKLGLESSPFLAGQKVTRVAGHPFSPFDYIQETIDGANGYYLSFEGANRLKIESGSVVVGYNLIPSSSAENWQLGDSTHAYRYLYLKDDNGTDRRVSINTSGVLTVT